MNQYWAISDGEVMRFKNQAWESLNVKNKQPKQLAVGPDSTYMIGKDNRLFLLEKFSNEKPKEIYAG